MPDPIDNYFDGKKTEEKETALRRCLKLFQFNEELRGLFVFNEMTNNIEFFVPPQWEPKLPMYTELDDIQISEIRSFLTKRYNFSPSKETILDAILNIAREERYHPIKDYINATKWDGTPRLDSWLNVVCGVEDNVYTCAVSRKILIAAIARIYRPGIKFDHIAILEGIQSARKSMLIEKMAIYPKYFTTISFSQTDKEITENMAGKWIVEVPEMHGFKKQEVERTKALLSRAVDRCRLAYARLAKDYPRQSVLIGTLNPEGENRYLADRTANRRYWPVVCGNKINIDLFLEMRPQLYAEAMAEFNKGENLWLDTLQLESHGIKEQELRQLIDPWDEIIEKWLELHKMQNIECAVSITDVATKALNIPFERMNNFSSARIGRAILKVQWRRKGNTSLFIPPGGYVEIVKDAGWKEEN